MEQIVPIANFLMLVCNVFALILVTKNPELHYKKIKMAIIISVSIGSLIMFGELTYLSAIFFFAPFIVLIRWEPIVLFFKNPRNGY